MVIPFAAQRRLQPQTPHGAQLRPLPLLPWPSPSPLPSLPRPHVGADKRESEGKERGGRSGRG